MRLPAAVVRHLNQKELARRWGLSVRTVERWRCDGSGPAFLKLNGRVAYRLADVEAFEDERLRTSTHRVDEGDPEAPTEHVRQITGRKGSARR
jgi:hypothetical protein